MSLAFFIAIVLGAITEAASARPVFASVSVARESRIARRASGAVAVRFAGVRSRAASRPRYRTSPLLRLVAPLTGAAAPRAPAAVR
jgi:hypothetical protein